MINRHIMYFQLKSEPSIVFKVIDLVFIYFPKVLCSWTHKTNFKLFFKEILFSAIPMNYKDITHVQ